jgi:hypothetical protein
MEIKVHGRRGGEREAGIDREREREQEVHQRDSKRSVVVLEATRPLVLKQNFSSGTDN